MKHGFSAQLDDVSIMPLQKEDIEYLRIWRNRDDVSRYLKNIGSITPEQQLKWYEQYLREEGVYYFGIEYANKGLVGSMALLNFEDERCEIGKLMIGEESARGHKVAQKAFFMGMMIANEKLGMNEYHLTVHEDNMAARKVYDRLGFERFGDHPFEKGGIEYEMSVDIERLKKNEYYDQVRIFTTNDRIS